MKVAIFSVDTFPRMGGVSVLTHHLANALTRYVEQVVLVGPKGALVPADYERHYLLCEDFASFGRAREGAAALQEDQRITLLAQRIFERYSIDRVLLMHPFYYGFPLTWLCSEEGIRSSVFIHGFELRSQLLRADPDALSVEPVARSFDRLPQRTFATLAMADEVLVNSRYTGSLIPQLRERAMPVRVVGCGLEQSVLERELQLTPTYDPEEKRQRRVALGLQGERVIGFVGRLIREKRVDRILDMAACDARVSVVIAGDGPERERLVEHARVLGLGERVRFVGMVSEDEKWQWLRALDAVCLLSEANDETGQVEGFGIALLEAGAVGALAIASGAGGTPDPVLDGEAGIILGDTSLHEATAIMFDTPQMQRKIDLAREALRSRFTCDAIARKLVAGWTQQHEQSRHAANAQDAQRETDASLVPLGEPT